METFLLIIRIILFAIFALAGIAKLYDLPGSKKAVKDFGVPEVLAKPLAVLLPVAEIIVAGLLIFVQTSWFGAIGASVLLTVFIGGMAYQMAKGNAPDCHCFGAVHSEPVSSKSLIRNAVFLIPAIGLIVAGPTNQGLNLFDNSNNISQESPMQIIIGLAVVGLLAAVVYFLKQISEQQTQIMRRIEILEFTAHEGTKEVEREDVSAPTEGLPIGAVAPDFSLSDISGREVSLKGLLTPKKATVFFFVSPTCNPCGALLPEIENWQESLKDKLDFVFISNGNAKENAEKLSGKTFKKILLQKEREVAELYGAKWTPTALLINPDGRIASHVTAGDTAIRELFAKIEHDAPENGQFLIAGTNGSSKIGQEIPAFELNDVTGKTVSPRDLQGKQTLVTYWSQGCGFCTRMLDDLREWDKTKGQDAPNLLIVSSGEAENHKEMNLNSPIVLDNERKLAQELGMNGTPSAVLINENGKIISEVAVGADNIWTLVGKKIEKKKNESN
jgi:peroxiredoxin/uncharacterized membrane protein YphA (DoxX/SURF4 family)